MNLRTIKKAIEYEIAAFLDDCFVVAETKGSQVAPLVEEAAELYNELRGQVHTKEKDKKAYYKQLLEELYSSTNALYEKLSAIVTQGN